MKAFNIKKIAVMFVISAMVLDSFAACTEGGSDPTNTAMSDNNSSTTVDTMQEEKYIDIVKNGELIPVVYGAYASAKEIAVAKSIIDGLHRIVGVSGRPEGEYSYDANKVEILVGDTSYPETAQVKSELGYGEGIVKIVGNKVVVIGSDTEALENIIKKLLAEFNNFKENGGIRLKSDFCLREISNELVAAMPTHPDAFPTITDTSRNCYLMDFGTDKETVFREYIDLLEKNGYRLYAENSIEGNEYYTYLNDEFVVTAIYTKYNKKAKFTVEKLENTGLPPRAEDNVYTPVEGLKSSITQVGLHYNVEIDEYGAMSNVSGMCYVIRLNDGSFIVVDGGFGQDVHVDNLYNTLKAQAPDHDNIVIAAWIFSHDHGDHTGTFVPFVNKYSDMVAVERFVFNFASKAQGNQGYATLNTMESYMHGFFKDAEIIKAHPGQVFHLRNAKITMLYTMDVYESKELKDTNNASIVWQMEMEGKTFMCLGDYSESSVTLKKLYTKETLKSDIVQIAHHGISGQEDGSIYPIIEPEYAFWPVGAYHVIFHSNGKIPDLELDKLTFNKYFMNTMDQNKVFLAQDDFAVMTIDDGKISTQVFEDNVDFMTNYKN